MNTSKAYQICHEIMLLSDNYVAREGTSITYSITQIAETDEAIHIQSMLINPALPEEGNLQIFMKRSLDQQVAILGLCPSSKAFRIAHQSFEAAMSKKLSNEETVQQLRTLLILRSKT